MAMINATPRRPSVIGMAIGAALLIGGIIIISSNWSDIWETAKPILLLFVAMFLILFGLGILTASWRR